MKASHSFEEKLEMLRVEVGLLIKSHIYEGKSAKEVLDRTLNVEAIFRKVRSAARARYRREHRATCPHPEESRHTYTNGESHCRRCGLKLSEAVQP